MTTNEILFGVGLVVVLAVGSQLLARRLRIPQSSCCCRQGSGELLFTVSPDGRLSIAADGGQPDVGGGDTVICLAQPAARARSRGNHPGETNQECGMRATDPLELAHMANRKGGAD